MIKNLLIRCEIVSERTEGSANETHDFNSNDQNSLFTQSPSVYLLPTIECSAMTGTHRTSSSHRSISPCRPGEIQSLKPHQHLTLFRDLRGFLNWPRPIECVRIECTHSCSRSFELPKHASLSKALGYVEKLTRSSLHYASPVARFAF
jgi:hypothetical protein